MIKIICLKFVVMVIALVAFAAQSAKAQIDDIDHIASLSQLSRDIDLPEDPQQTIDTLVFYAPGYADILGGHHKVIEKLFQTFEDLNELNGEQGFNARYRLVAVSPYKIDVPEGTPWFSYTDENGEHQPGIDSQIQGAAFAEYAGEEEFRFRQYFMPDMVYTTKHYEGERFFGTAANAVKLSVDLGELNFGGGTVLDISGSPRTTFNTWAHELGHNWGAGHQISDYEVPREEVRGHAYQCGTTRTIMWSSGGAGKFYSNPDVTINGNSCGDADEADNHAVISENIMIAPNLVTAPVTVGEVNFRQTSLSVEEGEQAIVELVRDGDLSISTRVTVVVWPHTAEYNADYTGGFYEIEFEEGQETAHVAMDILADATAETSEQLKAQLLFPGRMNVGGRDEMIIEINGSEEAGNIGSFGFTQDHVTVTEGDTIILTIERTNGSDGQVIVEIDRILGTANNRDVGAVHATVLFDVGETFKTLEMRTFQDNEAEEDETVLIRISSIADVTVSETTITIRDDDSGIIEKGEFSIEGTPTSVVEGSDFSFSITRAGGEGEAVLTLEIHYSNSANNSTQTITMPAGQSSQVLTVSVPENAIDEPDYSVTLTLSSKDEGVYFGNNGVSVAVTDNDATVVSTPSSSAESNSGGGSLFFLLSLSSILLIRRVTQ